MLNSRDISTLRSDVAANCRVFIELCKNEGLNVLVTQTKRDNEYQAYLYEQGRTRPGSIVTNSKTTSFHGVGLAFDICKNVKGHEYDDPTFFKKCGEIGKKMGFTWGGDWKSFPDQPHFQWDYNKNYTDAMVRTGRLPPMMEVYEEMTYEDWKLYMEKYRSELARKPASPYAKEPIEKAKKEGITDGSRPGDLITREEVITMLERKK